MADNTIINNGVGGDTIATDDIAGIKYQRVKITLGADGETDGDVSAANPIPISNASLIDIDTNTQAIRRGLTDYETRLDYDIRVDGNPVYVGKNLNGTATADATWTIQKLTYDAAARLTRAQVLTGSWDDRAVLGW